VANFIDSRKLEAVDIPFQKQSRSKILIGQQILKHYHIQDTLYYQLQKAATFLERLRT